MHIVVLVLTRIFIISQSSTECLLALVLIMPWEPWVGREFELHRN